MILCWFTCFVHVVNLKLFHQFCEWKQKAILCSSFVHLNWKKICCEILAKLKKLKICLDFFSSTNTTIYQVLPLFKVPYLYLKRARRDGNSSENLTPRGIGEWQFNIPRGSRKIKPIARGPWGISGNEMS